MALQPERPFAKCTSWGWEARRVGGWWVLFQTQVEGRVREADELFLAQSFLFKEASHWLTSHWPTGDHMATCHCTP